MFESLVTQPPLLYRIFFPEAVWRVKRHGAKVAYLTFDDGPVPEATPRVLEILHKYAVRATFFTVGDNARRYPELLEAVRAEGHSIGNHTMHHLQGRKTSCRHYLRDVREANRLLHTTLFRAPHGLLSWRQSKNIARHYNLIMYDVVTRDYARRITADEVLDNVRRFTRNGSIIVFHDSLKAADKMLPALPRAIEWLLSQGYELDVLSV